jgi:hypothetical protein
MALANVLGGSNEHGAPQETEKIPPGPEDHQVPPAKLY